MPSFLPGRGRRGTARIAAIAAVVALVAATPLVAQSPRAATPPPRKAPDPVLAPAPWAPPAPGTTFRYEGFAYRVTKTDGWRTSFVDDKGAPGQQLSLFFSEDPRQPYKFPADSIAALWPLRIGTRTSFQVFKGPLQWRYVVRVIGTERVAVPAGTFDTYLVTALELPLLTADPAGVRTRMTTFWYAPSINAVVRFLAITTTPTGEKSQRRVQLLSITPPSAAAARR